MVIDSSTHATLITVNITHSLIAMSTLSYAVVIEDIIIISKMLKLLIILCSCRPVIVWQLFFR